MEVSKTIKWGLAIILAICLIIVYRAYNPIDYVFYPKCPFRELTGLKCPGCGSQRAIHHILNFNFFSALKENFIVVLSIPYILTGLVFDSIKIKNVSILKWRKRLYGQKAIFVILIIIIGFWIIRNTN